MTDLQILCLVGGLFQKTTLNYFMIHVISLLGTLFDPSRIEQHNKCDSAKSLTWATSNRYIHNS